jgi:chorismate mutase
VTPHEEKEQRKIITLTSLVSIKSLDEECMELCEERMHLWKRLTEDTKMKFIKKILKNEQGRKG